MKKNLYCHANINKSSKRGFSSVELVNLLTLFFLLAAVLMPSLFFKSAYNPSLKKVNEADAHTIFTVAASCYTSMTLAGTPTGITLTGGTATYTQANTSVAIIAEINESVAGKSYTIIFNANGVKSVTVGTGVNAGTYSGLYN